MTWMREAKRPVLYLGGGANRPEAAKACEHLARVWDAPVALSLMALGALPVDHPLCMGLLGMHGAVTTNLLRRAQRGPTLLRLPVDARAHVLPMVPPGAANRDAVTADQQNRPLALNRAQVAAV